MLWRAKRSDINLVPLETLKKLNGKGEIAVAGEPAIRESLAKQTTIAAARATALNTNFVLV